MSDVGVDATEAPPVLIHGQRKATPKEVYDDNDNVEKYVSMWTASEEGGDFYEDDEDDEEPSSSYVL